MKNKGMTKADLIKELNEIMQRDMPLHDNDLLEEIEEWDSLATLSVLEMFDIEFGISLTVEDLREIKTVQDLIDLTSALES